MNTSQDQLAIAFDHHQRGEFARAEQLYRQVLAAQPRHADVWHLLGLVAYQTGRNQEAAESIQQAIQLQAQPAYFNHLGAVFAALSQFDRAEESFRKALALNAVDPQSHYNLGTLLGQLGRKEEAGTYYREAVRLQPNFAEAQFNLGNIYCDLDRLADAEACYTAAVAARPNYLKALTSLAAVQSLQGRFQQTEQLWRRVLAIEPNHVEALYRLGSLLQTQERLVEAAPFLERAVLLDPRHSAAQSNLGCVYRGLKQLDRAEQCFRLALDAKPDFPAALVNLASLLHDRRDYDAAIVYCRKALEFDPNSYAAHHNLCSAYHGKKKFELALEHARRSLEIDPNSVDALTNVGVTQLMLGQTEEGIGVLKRVIALDPKSPRARYSLAGGLHQVGRDDEALAAYDEALRIEPDSAETHYYRSFVHLSRGNFTEGWRDYEWRLKCKDYQLPLYDAPMWDGSPLAGRSLMVLTEQGLGDTLHFIRYLDVLKNQRGMVYVDVQAELAPLLKASGYTGVIARGAQLPRCDLRVPMLSLPRVLGSTLETIPRRVPYLAADPRLLKLWRSRGPSTEVFKVGIVWQGNPEYMFDHWRSIPLAEFAPLSSVAGVQWFSLQKGQAAQQVAGSPLPLVDWAPALESFLDTAAAICNLDLVITCDTAVGHLAGGLGLPVWLALPTPAEWRWLADRCDSPWYPTMRLFRQPRRGDWESVFVQMASELEQCIGKR